MWEGVFWLPPDSFAATPKSYASFAGCLRLRKYNLKNTEEAFLQRANKPGRIRVRSGKA